jgi:hypothetical protein
MNPAWVNHEPAVPERAADTARGKISVRFIEVSPLELQILIKQNRP